MYINYYLLVSLLLSLVCITKIKCDVTNIEKIKSVDPFKTFDELNEVLAELKDKSEFLGNLFENIANSILEGSNLTFFMFIITISLIPLFRWVLVVIAFKK